MTIGNLNLFAILAMCLTCAIGIALNPPSLRLGRFPRPQTVASSLASALRGRHAAAARGAEEYSIRHIARGDGGNQYFRFTIARVRSGYRAYIDSAPRLGAPLEQLGARCEDGRYYIDAGRRSSAADAEGAAKRWADAQSAALSAGSM